MGNNIKDSYGKISMIKPHKKPKITQKTNFALPNPQILKYPKPKYQEEIFGSIIMAK